MVEVLKNTTVMIQLGRFLVSFSSKFAISRGDRAGQQILPSQKLSTSGHSNKSGGLQIFPCHLTSPISQSLFPGRHLCGTRTCMLSGSSGGFDDVPRDAPAAPNTVVFPDCLSVDPCPCNGSCLHPLMNLPSLAAISLAGL